ncbi:MULTISPECIES: histidine phosphatase family protein [unclassified Fusibacter]|uniref:histidine phosphatase family protein n=1 Tax=unclassified Fusibacter TaxID=2624464 RepID=UPI0013E92498|nr:MULTISPECIES: histidine phosphatase family protein [unclassified Fusibacter]MCK8061194.1 histidine phosphatase family protein [Fusibacter sp. A2]NPE23269.1 histidine phosphatase family protein [Fusibacter sp. A1]
MTTIYLTRHGQTEWNLEGRSQGKLDSKLTELGRKQAQWLAERLQPISFDAVYTSTSGRTIETQEIIMAGKSVKTTRLEGLCEMDFGSWQGKLWDEVREENPKRYDDFWKNPSAFEPDCGESYATFVKRVNEALDEITQKHEGETILIVAHGGVLKAIYSQLQNIPLDEFWTQKPYMHSANLTIIERQEGSDTFLLQGCIDHYPEQEKAKFDY